MESSCQIKENIDSALKGAIELKGRLEELIKEMSPIYDKYKPFKDVDVDVKFILRKHLYRKCESFNMIGNTVNCYDITSEQYEYVPDFEWVIQID